MAQDKEKTDLYLIQDSLDSKFAGLLLLTDGNSTNPGLSHFFTSTGAPPVYSTSDNTPSRPKSTVAAPSAPAQPLPQPISSSSGSTRQPPVASSSTMQQPQQEQQSTLQRERRSSAQSVAPVSSQAGGSARRRVTTSVEKGDLGIGLDLGKSPAGEAQVLRLKELPPGVVNPASLSVPAILPMDVIVAVDGQPCATFAEAVKLIRATGLGKVQLTLERV